MSQELEQADKVYNLVQEIQEAKKQIAVSYLFIGKALEKIVENDLWTDYAGHLDKVEEFYKEIGFSASKARQCRQVYRVFNDVLDDDVPAFWRMKKLAPVCKDASEEKKKEWVSKAQELTTNDFKDEVRGAKGKTQQIDCEHPDEKRNYFFQCSKCKKWIKIDKEELGLS